MRVLLLEDDVETGDALAAGLTAEGHAIALARDVGTSLQILTAQSFDVAILDIMAPGGSGYDVLAEIRRGQLDTGVLLLTALGSVDDKVRGLDHGADDYLVKPFSFAELAARLRSIERRRNDVQATHYRIGDLEVDPMNRFASVNDSRIDLTPIEFGLLLALLKGRGDTLSRRELLREVWGYDFDPGTNIVDVHVNRLRRKLRDAGGPSDFISTVRGIGYAFR